MNLLKIVDDLLGVYHTPNHVIDRIKPKPFFFSLPYHGLVWDWSTDVVKVGEID